MQKCGQANYLPQESYQNGIDRHIASGNYTEMSHSNITDKFE